jgi:hypothetical protein
LTISLELLKITHRVCSSRSIVKMHSMYAAEKNSICLHKSAIKYQSHTNITMSTWRVIRDKKNQNSTQKVVQTTFAIGDSSSHLP